MKKVILLQGLPGCGKSTWAKELMKTEPGKWKRFNRDDLRAMIDDSVFSKQNETFIVSVQNDLIKSAISNGFNVIIDNTHLVPATVKKIKQLCNQLGDIELTCQVFNVPVAECLKRNALRTGNARVPDAAILGMAKGAGLDRGHKLNSWTEIFPAHTFEGTIQQENENLPDAIICDLDGTLANIAWRNPYDASQCDKDGVNLYVLELVKAMREQFYTIIFVSGRSDKFRQQTEEFLGKCINFEYSLFMRKEGDLRKDTIVKKEIYMNNINNKYYIQFVIDDRPSVVRMWRYELGIPVMQVNDKEF